jgi:hypothetical protein
VTHDYPLDVAALAEPDTLFGMSPDWTSLSHAEKDAVVTEAYIMAGERTILPIQSTALIASAQRRAKNIGAITAMLADIATKMSVAQ